MFFHPIQPFLEFICRNWHQIDDSKESSTFSHLSATILEFSPLLEETTQFVLSSSFALTFTASLVSLETAELTLDLLRSVEFGFRSWQKDDPAVRKRGQQIVTKLRDEGLSDELELHFQSCGDYSISYYHIFLGARAMTQLGGNARCWGNLKDWELSVNYPESDWD
ncbi:hypothetical protein BLNAU_6025 [Blattamonas nauphoetae]|uniref:Uncharacterized protein n=1 Tax=Blattamonas nauphoetae TaxID=2049346 RepID=A0ABQ9Y5M1_9EUKA|nr:hypothetical protein BLNAU_6025 [Blattamonas nauphoetae]